MQKGQIQKIRLFLQQESGQLEPVCLVSLDTSSEDRKLGLMPHPKGNVDKVKKVLKEAAQHWRGEFAARPDDTHLTQRYWSDLQQRLADNGFIVKDGPGGDFQLRITIDSVTGHAVSKVVPLHEFYEVSLGRDSVVRRVHDAVSHAWDGHQEQLLDTMNKALDDGNDAAALRALGDAVGYLRILPRPDEILGVALRMDLAQMSSEDRRIGCEMIFFLAAKLTKYDEIEHLLHEYLQEFGDQLKPVHRDDIKLALANAAGQKRLTETALTRYHELLGDEDKLDPSIRAWVHRGVAVLLGRRDPGFYSHLDISCEAFRQAGNIMEAIRSAMGCVRYLKVVDPEEALALLDEMQTWFDPSTPTDSCNAAGIAQERAEIFFDHGRYNEALIDSLQAVGFVDGVIGVEGFRVRCLSLAASSASRLGDVEQETSLRQQVKIEAKAVQGKVPFVLALLQDYLDGDQTVQIDELEAMIEAEDDPFLETSLSVAKALVGGDLDYESRVRLLDEALVKKDVFSDSVEKDDLIVSIHSSIAEVHMRAGEKERALKSYANALRLRPLDTIARQNTAALLWELGKWDKAVAFFRVQRRLLPDEPSVLYGLGYSLSKIGRNKAAFKVLRKAQRMEVKDARLAKLIEDCVHDLLKADKSIDDVDGGSTPPAEAVRVGLEDLEAALDEFADTVKQAKRMEFWRRKKGSRQHKWIPKPERLAQNLFHVFIKGAYLDLVEVFEEIRSGAGFVDLLLAFSGGLRVIVELKMCGAGYSRPYALKGLDQLNHYMENRNTYVGHLLVFDGRKRDFGKGFPSKKAFGKGTLDVRFIDVRAKVKQKA